MKAPSPIRTPTRARLAAVQHRVLLYVTCYNVLDGYVPVGTVVVRSWSSAWFVFDCEPEPDLAIILYFVMILLTFPLLLTLQCYLHHPKTRARNTSSRSSYLYFDYCLW